ncbi:MAG: N-6 DNA methylase [Gemmatimonadaceae bacterium]|nr:N-6 DNA methylase [Gemmatimonadaceae bacterium]
MLTAPAAHALLARASHPDGRRALLAALGFSALATLRFPRERALLGLGTTTAPAALWRTPEGIHAVLIDYPDAAPDATVLARLARSLDDAAPVAPTILVAASPSEVAFVVPIATGRVRAWRLEPAQLRPTDAETLVALHAARVPTDARLTRLQWGEVLGRDALTTRFYRDLERQVHRIADSAPDAAPADARRALALLHSSRLLFLAFLERKGWLDGDADFLRNHATRVTARVHDRVLAPLWFGTLNTPWPARAARARAFGRVPFLNGGLFARTPLEQRFHRWRIDDDALIGLLDGVFARYRLTARETQTTASEAAVDPEMLGRAFESLMASDERRRSGAFYTPPALVASIVDDAISDAMTSGGLDNDLLGAALASAPLSTRDATVVRDAVDGLRVLDPACGSGAFLVATLERLAGLGRIASDGDTIAARRRAILGRSIFGVDINPMAVWLCELRLWLSVVVDAEASDPMRVAPLPNLDRNIRVGDALGAPEPTLAGIDVRAMQRLRARYPRATGARKRELTRALEREERRFALATLDECLLRRSAERRDLLASARSRDLFGGRSAAGHSAARQRLRAEVRTLRGRIAKVRAGAAIPFAFASHFADVHAAGGFSLIVGNPPWVRPHELDPGARAGWLRRSALASVTPWRASPDEPAGFGVQLDVAALFIERALELAAPGGTIALLVPAKLWGSIAGSGVRAMLRDRATLVQLRDLIEAPALFAAVTYPSVLICRSTSSATVGPATISVHRTQGEVRWSAAPSALGIDADPRAPWLLHPPPVRRAFDRLARAGVHAHTLGLARPTLGVKTGCNDAFIVRCLTPPPATTVMIRDVEGVTGRIPRRFLRPLLRGESMRPWRAERGDDWIVWPYDEAGVLAALPPSLASWFAPRQRALRARTDARGDAPWWSLFRLDGAACAHARVVCADIGRHPRASVLLPGDEVVALNSCYVLRARTVAEADALATILNAGPMAAWLSAVAEPARGGYRRFLGWTLARLPLPREWDAAVQALAPIGASARCGTPAPAGAIAAAVLACYDVPARQVAPLMEWFPT